MCARVLRIASLGTLVLALALSPVSLARERLARVYGAAEGIHDRSVSVMVHDERGFLWLGTDTQILRFDGSDFSAVNAEPLTRHPESLAIDPLEGVLFTDLQRAFRLVDGAREPYDPAVQPSVGGGAWLRGGPGASLWVVDEHGVRHRDGQGGWRSIPHERFGSRIRYAFPLSSEQALAWSWSALWLVDAWGVPQELYHSGAWLTRAIRTGDGRILVTEKREDGSYVLEVDEGEGRVLFRALSEVALELIARDEAVWVSGASELARWHPREGHELFLEGDTHGGQLRLLDREGSLWIAGLRGLVQLVDERSAAWTKEDGLPETLTTHVVRVPEGVITTHYGGLGLIAAEDGRLAARSLVRARSNGRGCFDGERFWQSAVLGTEGADRRGLWRVKQGRAEFVPTEEPGLATCSPAQGGGAWFAIGDVLYRTSARGEGPERVMGLPDTGNVHFCLLETRDGDLWLGGEHHVCHLGREALVQRDAAAWSCERLDGLHSVQQIVETPSGRIWMRAFQGVFWLSETGFAPLPGFPRGLSGLAAPSPRGGVWLASNRGAILRVEEDLASPDYRVIERERLTLRSGLLYAYGNVHEDADGTVWVASRAGVQRVPPAARAPEAPSPRVELVAAHVGERSLPLDAETKVLSAEENDLDLRFAALSYRHREGLRYRVRVRAADPWEDSESSELRFQDLGPGEYHVAMAASIDGTSWSEEPAEFSFVILPPWHGTWWARSVFAGVLVLLAYGAYRLRVAVLLRFERQRMRIAMDLHDEMGSGLGSIGVLSGLLGSEGIDEAARIRLASQIESNVGELSGALSDIVWSLRPRARSLGAVLRRLENRAHQLAPEARIEVRFPAEVDSVRASAPLAMNLVAIGNEALHNAARHGRPRTIELHLRERGGRFVLVIADDGRGFETGEQLSEGVGLESMRRRAGFIDADIRVESEPGRGTRVELVFRPEAGDRRVMRRPHDRADDGRTRADENAGPGDRHG